MNENRLPAANPYLGWLDALKGVAFLGIIFNHYAEELIKKWGFGNPLSLGWPSVDWPSMEERFAELKPLLAPSSETFAITLLKFLSFSAEQTTDLFILLSGFAVAWSLCHRQVSSSSLEFLWGRVKRLYPLWWAAHIVILVPLAIVGIRVSLLDPNFYWSLLGVRITPEQMSYGVPSWWYVTCLLQLLLIAVPMWRFAIGRSAYTMLFIALVVGWSVRAWVIFYGLEFVNPWGSIGLVRLPEFALGLALGISWSAKPTDVQFDKRTILVGCVMLIAALPMAGTKLGMIFVPFIRALALWWVLGSLVRRLFVGRFWVSRSIRWLGVHSYSIYLTHHVVQYFVVRLTPWSAEAPATFKFAWIAGIGFLTLVLSCGTGVLLELSLASLSKTWRVVSNRVELKRLALSTTFGVVAMFVLIAFFDYRLYQSDPLEIDDKGWGERPALVRHAEFGWTLRPGSETHLRWDTYDYRVSANYAGFPGPEFPPAERRPNVVRVMTLGDAFASAEGVDTVGSWPRIIERTWSETGSSMGLEMMNFGVTGYGPNQYAAIAKHFIPELRPDVVVVALFTNDFTDVSVSNEEFAERIGFGKPDGPFWLERLTGQQITQHVKRFLARFVMEDLLSRPNGRGVTLGQFELMRIGNLPWLREQQALVLGRMHEIADVTALNGASLLLAMVPAPSQVCESSQLEYWPKHLDFSDASIFDHDQPQRLMQEIATEIHADVVDLRSALRRSSDSSPCFTNNWHWTQSGHAAVAEALIAYLQTAIE